MINLLTLFTALLLSTVAAFYSVVGLTAIFSTAFWPIVIMGGSLELAKVVAASWVYRNWYTAPKTIKYYLTAAVAVLMLITSMGTFGYLSKAHLDQAVPTGDVASKLSIIDEKIKTERDTIETARKALNQLDAQVDQTVTRSSDEKGMERAVQIRRGQQKERTSLMADIGSAQGRIARLNEERAPIASELRKITAEVGPIKYIAELIYGEASDSIIDKSVRWVIILIVVVFDPLALALLIAANSSINYRRPIEEDPVIAEMIREDKDEKKDYVPRWIRRTQELNRKRKAGKIEIDPNQIKDMKDGGSF